MVKKHISRNDSIKVILFVVLTTVAIFAAVTFLVTRGSHAPAAPSQTTVDGKAAITGLAVCLPHKNTDGPQTLECAIGLKDDKGIYYSLTDTSETYANVAQIQSGKRYEIIGNLEERSDPKYQTAGFIRIDKVNAL